jgi:hypothetical protein
MNDPHPLMVRLYRGALVIYPLRLRFQYRDQMVQTLCDAYHDRSAGKMRFWLRAYADLIQSSFTERFNMARDEVVQSPLVFHTLALAAIISLLGGGAALVIDQMMRVGAGNQPQMEMADWYVGEISAGEEPGNVIPPGYVDLERSLQPFVIFYDDQGRPLRGTGYLDQKLPAPPPGVFEFVRSHGIEKVTWQPQHGVRLATVIRRVDIHGKSSGFVLAGRSLRLVEEQKSILWRMALIIWIIVMALLFGGASLLHRTHRVKPTSA